MGEPDRLREGFSVVQSRNTSSIHIIPGTVCGILEWHSGVQGHSLGFKAESSMLTLRFKDGAWSSGLRVKVQSSGMELRDGVRNSGLRSEFQRQSLGFLDGVWSSGLGFRVQGWELKAEVWGSGL